MRDLERLKKQKVYSHSLLAISFPDGCVCKGQFLPGETVEKVMISIQQDLLSVPLEFELYVTPPRTKLLPKQTLQELGLVPAAKVHVRVDGEQARRLGVDPQTVAEVMGIMTQDESFQDISPICPLGHVDSLPSLMSHDFREIVVTPPLLYVRSTCSGEKPLY